MKRLEEFRQRFARRLKPVAPVDRALRGQVLTGVSSDSKRIDAGFIFCGLKGRRTHGADFAAEAVRRGAKVFLFETPVPSAILRHFVKAHGGGVSIWKAQGLRTWLGELANWVYDDPSEKLKVFAVTGTSGKTTICYFLESIAAVAGIKCGVLGTVSYRVAGEVFNASLTTPQPDEAIALMARMVQAGCRVCFMEATSQALDMGRLDDLVFDGAVFGNLSRDHLDYHKTMEKYFKAKTRLFLELLAGSSKKDRFAAVHAADPWGAKLSRLLKRRRGIQYFNFGISEKDGNTWDIRALGVESSLEGTTFDLEIGGRAYPVHLKTVGRHNVQNALAAATAAYGMNLSPHVIVQGLAALEAVPGRLERIPNSKGILALVDYAHKPDALENVLEALGTINGLGRRIVVVGCGGDRDPGKRPLMGEIAVKMADWAVFTSDNPRSEDPRKILSEIEEGAKRAGKNNYQCEVNRRKAISLALGQARSGDCVLIAGKGHETYQIFADKTIHFDDREVCREILGSLEINNPR